MLQLPTGKVFNLKKFLLRTRRFFYTKEYSWNNAEQELQRRLREPLYLEQFGYKVYSQNDEDGIIEEIFNRIGTTNKKFIEFGVQDGLESNGHFLLHKGWQGLWIEGSKGYCSKIRKLFKKPLEQKQLVLANAFITAENINEIISGNFAEQQIDLLCIDIDGNDYHVWNVIKCVSPRVVVVEYNSVFPPKHEWIMPYNANHVWDKNDYMGASLKSFEILGKTLGYQLVGTNLNGVNAFFVKKDLAKDLFVLPASAENLYNPARYDIVYRTRFASNTYIG
jgi:hypothetical protein